jgi:hypothetical protein
LIERSILRIFICLLSSDLCHPITGT